MLNRLRISVICSLLSCVLLLAGCDDPISYQGYKAPAHIPAIIPQYVTVEIRVKEQLTEAPSTRSEHKWEFEFKRAELSADTANGESLISLLLHMQESSGTQSKTSYVALKSLNFEMDRLAVFESSSLQANTGATAGNPSINLTIQESWPVTNGPELSFDEELPLTLKHHTPTDVDKEAQAPDHLSMSFSVQQSAVKGSNHALSYTIEGDIRLYY